MENLSTVEGIDAADLLVMDEIVEKEHQCLSLCKGTGGDYCFHDN